VVDEARRSSLNYWSSIGAKPHPRLRLALDIPMDVQLNRLSVENIEDVPGIVRVVERALEEERVPPALEELESAVGASIDTFSQR
jgi:hypothetical protein